MTWQRVGLISFIVVGIVGLDQLSKQLILFAYPNLVLFNARGTWGLLPAWLGPVIAIGLLIWLIKKQESNFFWWIILGAGISNALDRWWYPGVVDFIHVFSFPVFNLADALISISIVWLLVDEVFRSHKQARRKTDNTPERLG